MKEIIRRILASVSELGVWPIVSGYIDKNSQLVLIPDEILLELNKSKDGNLVSSTLLVMSKSVNANYGFSLGKVVDKHLISLDVRNYLYIQSRIQEELFIANFDGEQVTLENVPIGNNRPIDLLGLSVLEN